MAQSWATVPAVTIHRTVAFAELLALRDQLRDAGGRRPALDALLAGLVGRTLQASDVLNGSWLEEQRAVIFHDERNIAVAVDTVRGLTAVVLRGADRRAPWDLDASLISMVERARAGRSVPADVADATFTITNLGGLGVEWFDPIVPVPQSAILGVGVIREDPPGVRPAVLSLSFDHRVADGADAARFLDLLCSSIARPSF